MSKKNKKLKILVEHVWANPNKPLHIWQARNMCIWDSVIQMLKFVWHDVHSNSIGNDYGVNVWYNIVWHLYYDYPIENTEPKTYNDFFINYKKDFEIDEKTLNFDFQIDDVILTQARDIIKKTIEFDDYLQKAVDEYKPNYISKYLFELCQQFNQYYQSTKILDENDLNWTKAKIFIIQKVKQTIKKWMQIIWIPTIEEM